MIFTEIFPQQYENKESFTQMKRQCYLLRALTKDHNTTTGRTTRITRNANRIKRLEKQSHDFSESLDTCQSIRDDKVEQIEKKFEKLQKQVKSETGWLFMKIFQKHNGNT